MENLNKLPQSTVSADKLFHLHDNTDLESELFDAILSAESIFSFKDYCKSVNKKYTQEQISKALQSLQNKKFRTNENQFNTIKLHFQSIFPYSTPQTSDHWLA